MDDLSTELGLVDGKIDIIDTNLDSVKADVESATFGLSALKTLIDAVQTTVDGVSNVTRFVASVPKQSIIPSAGNKDTRVFMQLIDNNGNLEDPDTNKIEVTAFDVNQRGVGRVNQRLNCGKTRCPIIDFGLNVRNFRLHVCGVCQNVLN